MKPFLLFTLTLLIVLVTAVTLAHQGNEHAVQGPHGFENRYLHSSSRGSFLQWQLERLWDGLPHPPHAALATVPPDLTTLQHPGNRVTVTWIGHATVLLQLDGLNVLTDPMFSDYASPLPPFGPKRHQPPGVSLAQLPHVDVVLISHNHYDHMDLDSLRALARQKGGPPLFLVPLGNAAWFRDNLPELAQAGEQRRVHAMDWGDDVHVPAPHGDLVFHFEAVQHWSARTLWDRNETLWGSWVLIHPAFRFWFSGDLGYSPDTADIGRKYGGFDLAAIAIGAYAPRWFMAPYHLDPAEAVRVMQEVGARQALAIHWGTFQLSDEPLDQPPIDLAQALKEQQVAPDRFLVFRHGETRTVGVVDKSPPAPSAAQEN